MTNEITIKAVRTKDHYVFFFLNEDGKEYIFASQYLDPFEMAEEIKTTLIEEMYDFGWRKYERLI